MPLTELTFYGARKIRDLAPLKDMQLQSLMISQARITDLTPLKGMKLKKLELTWMKISDISALKGMPLIHLSISGTRVTDLTPLKGMQLERIGFSPHRTKKGIDIIVGMRSLKRIYDSGARSYTREEFLKKYNSGGFK